MIDISDGFLQDLGHICEESGVGAVVEADKIPISPSALKAADILGVDALEAALSGGEDYELIMTVPEEKGEEVSIALDAAVVGRIRRKKEGLKVVDRRGRRINFQAKGYEHFRRSTL